jgi:hypothetical protein
MAHNNPAEVSDQQMPMIKTSMQKALGSSVSSQLRRVLSARRERR